MPINRVKDMNRRDHYIPQGYLRGFMDPARMEHPRPLLYFDIGKRAWFERSPKEVGYRYGFYDYATSEIGVETADAAFGEFERTFPKIRRDLIENDFKNWRDYLDFLLRYAQMMRARSLLFFEHQQAEGKNLRAWVVEEVSADRKSVRIRSMTPEALPPAFIKNWTITQMRTEIQKGAAWLSDFKWALRYCGSPTQPFVIAEMPFIAHGPHLNLMDAVRDPETLLFFPLCWKACLIGSRRAFDAETDKFGDEDMKRFARMCRESAKLFVLSPRRLDFA